MKSQFPTDLCTDNTAGFTSPEANRSNLPEPRFVFPGFGGRLDLGFVPEYTPGADKTDGPMDVEMTGAQGPLPMDEVPDAYEPGTFASRDLPLAPEYPPLDDTPHTHNDDDTSGLSPVPDTATLTEVPQDPLPRTAPGWVLLTDEQVRFLNDASVDRDKYVRVFKRPVSSRTYAEFEARWPNTGYSIDTLAQLYAHHEHCVDKAKLPTPVPYRCVTAAEWHKVKEFACRVIFREAIADRVRNALPALRENWSRSWIRLICGLASAEGKLYVEPEGVEDDGTRPQPTLEEADTWFVGAEKENKAKASQADDPVTAGPAEGSDLPTNVDPALLSKIDPAILDAEASASVWRGHPADPPPGLPITGLDRRGRINPALLDPLVNPLDRDSAAWIFDPAMSEMPEGWQEGDEN